MKALVVVDMQNDFVDGSLGSPEAQAIVPKVISKMNEMADEHALLVLTQDTHYEDYLETQEGKNLPVPHCIKDTHGWAINTKVNEAASNPDFVVMEEGGTRIYKDTFGSTELGTWLSMNGKTIDEVVLIGLCTDICVVSNALLIKAFMPEVKITVDASCCAGVTPEKHAAALETMRSCQINVIND